MVTEVITECFSYKLFIFMQDFCFFSFFIYCMSRFGKKLLQYLQEQKWVQGPNKAYIPFHQLTILAVCFQIVVV